MSDPASSPEIEAARRAWVEKAPWDEDVASGAVRPPVGFVAAAREALAPLRELHRTFTEEEGYVPSWPRQYCTACTHEEDGVWMAWPCATARLVYPSEEL